MNPQTAMECSRFGRRRIISYIRVSTQKQGRSGLGLEAQRAANAQFASREGFAIAAEFTEVETGKAPTRLIAGRSLPPRWPTPDDVSARSSSPSWTG